MKSGAVRGHFKAVLAGILCLAGGAFLWAGNGVDDGSSSAAGQGALHRTWLGPDGQKLPFETDEQVLDFLRTAEVVSMKRIGSGVTGAQKVALAKDGIRMNACFRTVRQEGDKVLMEDGSFRYNFRDDARFEVAAYHLSRLLGLNNVPPAVERRIGDEDGSLQIWVEGVMTEKERLEKGIRPQRGLYLFQQMQNMRAFDSLIYNDDRNRGNILLSAQGQVWLIDHTRSFRRWRQLREPEKVTSLQRSFFERLTELDPRQIESRLSPYVKPQELRGLLKRRQILVQHIEQMIQQYGQDRVLFDLTGGGSS
ncbi:MAG TPA: hypothetical protein VLV83_01145 [Acidobacteriota bacterium]|nr:hypothetical protein [Acidobacteriota bacterium]